MITWPQAPAPRPAPPQTPPPTKQARAAGCEQPAALPGADFAVNPGADLAANAAAPDGELSLHGRS